MPHAARIGLLVVGAVALGLAGLSFDALPVRGESQVQTVTTDTPEYCLQLLDKVSELVRLAPRPAPTEVTDLSTEGQRMCDQGQTLGGILRLRRALMLLTGGTPEP